MVGYVSTPVLARLAIAVPGCLLLVGCEAEQPSDVTYGGWVYDGPSSSETVLADGALTFTVAGEEVPAEQPYSGYPGYWVATLPPHEPFQLRVESEAAYTSVWAGDTPSANGSWFAGALFTPERVWFDELIASLDLPFGVSPGALSDGAIHAWGLVNEPDAWDCAELTLQGAAVQCFAFDDEGVASRVTSGAFDWFFAFDLAAGEVLLEEGGQVVESWTAQEGDVVMALWLEHG